jgi:hypothetical protein
MFSKVPRIKFGSDPVKSIFIINLVISLTNLTCFAKIKTLKANIENEFYNQQVSYQFPSDSVEINEFPDYYSIDDFNSEDFNQKQQALITPSQIGQDFLNSSFQLVHELQHEALSLVRWMHHSSPLMDPPDKYNRAFHYGSWVNDPSDDNCYNTRARVLVRDSLSPVTFKANNKCVVESGAWVDPYTNQVFNEARDIQIDHVVPLKNSYVSGAWKWDKRRRCIYANYMGNEIHLMSVSGHENMSKSDKTPEQYMPPNSQYKCAYIKNWLAIKLEWGLVMTPPEANAIKNIIEREQCNLEELQLTAEELQRQRDLQNNLEICQKY